MQISTLLESLNPILNTYARLNNINDVPEIRDFAFVDSAALVACEDITDAEIVATVSSELIDNESTDDEEPESEIENFSIEKVEASLAYIRKYLMSQSMIPVTTFKAFDEVQRSCNESRFIGLRQTNIEKYFLPATKAIEECTPLPEAIEEEYTLDDTDALRSVNLNLTYSAEELRYNHIQLCTSKK